MKVVKLRKNWNLYKEGYTHAFRFDSWNYDSGAVIAALNKIYNNRQWRGRYYAWGLGHGELTQNKEGRWIRPTYIAVRSEAVVTQVLLTL